MLLRVSALILGLWLVGCSAEPELPGQSAAVSIIRGAYSIADGPALSIEWMQGDCAEVSGEYRGYSTLADIQAGDQCAGGEYFKGSNWAQVVGYRGSKFSGTSLAHETYHQAMEIRTGDPDHDHRDPGFGPGGVVDWANKLLGGASL